MALGMRVASPSSGASTVALPFSTPMAEFEVPKSNPQAIMESPLLVVEGIPHMATGRGLPDCFILPRLCPSDGMAWIRAAFPAHRQHHKRQGGTWLDAAHVIA